MKIWYSRFQQMGTQYPIKVQNGQLYLELIKFKNDYNW